MRLPPVPAIFWADSTRRAKDMRWETPTATEFRFGMEITLYIARR
ncbi:MAG: pyrroloquinoline quinone precursor peptide PqqA [Gammaproteobacteria bacterium]|nr:pyrroloquinoline quinone precursor peptide PqqA [Gammaproteobacteria bacterium]MBV9622062.1 pyrroloquinoline quinone precursor peptide PqqA [Gammaproteobacteria bacterium]